VTVAVLLGVLVGVTVAVLVGVREKVGVQVCPEPSVQTVLVTVKVKVLVGAAGLEGLLLFEGQPMVKKTIPINNENIPRIRNFIARPPGEFKTLGQTIVGESVLVHEVWALSKAIATVI
jgi:hypothetical protein